MLLKPNTDTVVGTIVAPDGSLINKPTRLLSADEAKVIRAYKKIKIKYGLLEENRCAACWNGDREDGMRGFTTDAQILFECRCQMIFHEGQTY